MQLKQRRFANLRYEKFRFTVPVYSVDASLHPFARSGPRTDIDDKDFPIMKRSKFFPVLLIVFLFAGPRAALFAAEGEAEAGTKAAVRIIVLKGAYEDHPSAPGLDPLTLLSGDLEKPGSFFALCEKIDDLAKNEKIGHLLFDLSAPNLQLDHAQLSELRRHIAKVRAAKKRTFAWLETAGTIQYCVASSCDTVLMAELGALDLPSLSLSTLHFHDAMELIGAKASVARVGEFKGAVEPFTLSEMSEGLRAHYREMLSTMNDALVDGIATGRKLERAQVRKLQGERLFTASAAAKARLVDSLAPFGGERDAVAKQLGLEAREITWALPPKSQPKQLGFFELFAKIVGGGADDTVKEPTLAVLHLDGMIVDGDMERPGFIAADPTVKSIEEVASDKNIQAVVVRINSPGGSATASEAIRRALEKLAARKPVTISMGSLAASGGYWITCLGRPIYAEPGTLTGSIGVFALKLSFGSLLKKIGFKLESVTLDESAGAMSLDRGWTAGEQEKMQGFVDDFYEKFLSRVAASRKMKIEEVNPVAGGRVWSGAQAVKLGLVDHLGGVDDAMAAAAAEAKLKPGFEVIHRPRHKSMFETMDLFGGSSDEIRALSGSTVGDYLRHAGFNLAVPLNLVRESLAAQPAKAWLLAPTEFVVR